MLKLPAYHNFVDISFPSANSKLTTDKGGMLHLRSTVDAKQILMEIFSVPGQYIPETLIDHSINHMLLASPMTYKVRNYSVGTGTPAAVMLKDPATIYRNLASFLNNIINKHDAERAEIAQYLTGKGFTASELSNLTELLVENIVYETGEDAKDWEDKGYTHVTVEVIDFSDINNSKDRYYNIISPREPVSPYCDGLPICGVLMEAEDGYELLDGRRRIKHEIMDGRSEGTFIIVS